MLLYGIVGALALRAVLIALGAAVLDTFSFAFLLFGAVLAATAVKILRDARKGHDRTVDVDRLERPPDPPRGPRDRRLPRVATVRPGGRARGRRALTPLALAVVAVLAADVVFAVDSVPAVYGITADPYLVFATNAFALLGLRALYFLLEGALARLVHLAHGLAVILAVIAVKLVLHWAHGVWPGVPEIPTPISLGVIVVILIIVTITSAHANHRDAKHASPPAEREPRSRPGGSQTAAGEKCRRVLSG